MFNSLKKIYYRWVVKNLEADLFELETINSPELDWSMDDKRLLEFDIESVKIHLKYAKVQLGKLEGQ